MKRKGESGSTIEVLQKLKYDKDESKVDYIEELNILKLIWEHSCGIKSLKTGCRE